MGFNFNIDDPFLHGLYIYIDCHFDRTDDSEFQRSTQNRLAKTSSMSRPIYNTRRPTYLSKFVAGIRYRLARRV